MEYGLIGKTLGHSFSKPIHEALGGYPYELKELPDEAAVRAFFTARRFRAVNVTIPYKALALALCDEVSEEAKAIGAVNTVVNRGGRLFGYNTDFGGFRLLVRHRGVSLAGKTVLILGTGATQRTVRAVCTAEGAAQVLCASRSAKPGALRYEPGRCAAGCERHHQRLARGHVPEQRHLPGGFGRTRRVSGAGGCVRRGV